MKKFVMTTLAAGLLTSGLLAAGNAQAQQTVKIGLIAPMTGPQAAAGRQMVAGAKLYMALNGNKAAGKTIELIVKDDTGVADITRRLGACLSSSWSIGLKSDSNCVHEQAFSPLED
jgi:branched-chain amino acid transport system substrate-binding protein